MSAKRTKGTREVPFTKAEYDKLVNDSSWTGGWVSRDNTTVYITCQGKVEQDVGWCTLGSKENPFSDQAYYEMAAREEFVGGYVLFVGVDEPSYRYPSGASEPEGSGCGSASGCGCGSGSGSAYIEAGSTVIDTEHFRADVKWSAGATVKGNVDMSRLEVPAMEKTDENISVVKIEISWDAAYTIKLVVHYLIGKGDSAVRNHDEATVRIYGI